MAQTTEPETTIYFSDYDQMWHAWVDLRRPLPNGKADRRHRRSKDRDKLVQVVLELEALRAKRIVPPKGKRQRAAKWMTYWLENLAGVRGGYNTMEIRKWAINLYLIPRLGAHWLDSLETEHFDLMYAQLHAEGLSARSIGLIHETAMLAINKAINYKFIFSNPAADADRPPVEETEVEPLNSSDTLAFLQEAMRRPNFLRWVFGALGCRQGECLGARWMDLENDQWLNVSAKVQRQKYRHGCSDPRACAAKRCNSACQRPWRHGCADISKCVARHCKRQGSCPLGCTGHAKACPERVEGPCNKSRHKVCPPPCPKDCTGHAKACPERVGGLMVIQPEQQVSSEGEVMERRKGSRRPTKRRKKIATKTQAGTRRVGIPSVFRSVIHAHRLQQAKVKARAGSKWQEHGLIICDEFGGPIDRSSDWREWADILETAGIEHLPLHGLRHTAATILLALKVDRRIVMAIMGWKDERMLARYQHVADELRREVAELLSGVFTAGDATIFATLHDQDAELLAAVTAPQATFPQLTGPSQAG